MAGKAKTKVENDGFITYVVVKPHDGLKEGCEVVRKAGNRLAEYCVERGLWKVKPTEQTKEE